MYFRSLIFLPKAILEKEPSGRLELEPLVSLLMAKVSPKQPVSQDLLQNVIQDFEALVRVVDNSIKAFAPDEHDGEIVERLGRARLAAERGAHLARSFRKPS